MKMKRLFPCAYECVHPLPPHPNPKRRGQNEEGPCKSFKCLLTLCNQQQCRKGKNKIRKRSRNDGMSAGRNFNRQGCQKISLFCYVILNILLRSFLLKSLMKNPIKSSFNSFDIIICYYLFPFLSTLDYS